MASSSTAFSVSDRFQLLLPRKELGPEFAPLLDQVKHMAKGGDVSQYQGPNHAAMIRFTKEGTTCQLTVMPCPSEPLSAEPFVCGAASFEDSLTVYYVDGLRAAGFTATIHRTVAGHPIVEVAGRSMYRVELKQ